MNKLLEELNYFVYESECSFFDINVGEAKELIDKIEYNKTLIQGLDNTIEAYEKTIVQQEDKIDKLENIIEEIKEYCINSSMTLKSHYFSDILEIIDKEN